MFKTFYADKDTYITNRIIDGVRSTKSNVGTAGTLDLFKIYGHSLSGSSYENHELSRALVHFDLTSLFDLYDSSAIDPTDQSFYATLVLHDVYGGQPTPRNYTLAVCALSRSFDEGLGKDIVFYSDKDSANYVTSSNGNLWLSEGCVLSSSVATDACDYYIGDYRATQTFSSGEENLNIDVTTIVSGVLTRTIPDTGFRIAYADNYESDYKTYFVKRFASRHAYDESKHPKLIVGFDDSYRDTSIGMSYDETARMFLHNYRSAQPANLFTTTGAVTGSNCIILKLQLPISGGVHDLIFTGSQLYIGSNPVTGVYYADVYVSSSNSNVITQQALSGSNLKFTPIWSSTNTSISFKTGSATTVYDNNRSSSRRIPKSATVTVSGLNATHERDETVNLKVNVFDAESPTVFLVKTPKNSPGTFQGFVSDAHYSVRDAITQEVIIPFDTTNNSTRLSGDTDSLFFSLDMSNFVNNRTYVIDIMLKIYGAFQTYRNVSPVFKVSDSHI